MLQQLKFWLSDFVPYSRDSWVGLLEYYNGLYWPYSLIVVPVVLAVVWMGNSQTRLKRKAAMWLLALCWLWAGLVFLRIHFSILNWAAGWLYWLFVLQAILLVVYPLYGNFEDVGNNRPGYTRRLFIMIVSLVFLPMMQLVNGHEYSELSWFALTPDTTAIATLAILGYLGYASRALMVIPLVWSVLIFASSWPLGMIAEMSLLPVSFALALFRVRLFSERSPA